MRGTPVDERTDGLVGACGILDQEQQDAFVPDGDALEAAERRGETPEARGNLVELRAERAREGRSCDRVVDVVEAGKRELDGTRSVRRVEPERRARESVDHDVPPCYVERWPGVVAARTAVVAEVADIRRGVDVRRAAADAVLRVGRVLE